MIRGNLTFSENNLLQRNIYIYVKDRESLILTFTMSQRLTIDTFDQFDLNLFNLLNLLLNQFSIFYKLLDSHCNNIK